MIQNSRFKPENTSNYIKRTLNSLVKDKDFQNGFKKQQQHDTSKRCKYQDTENVKVEQGKIYDTITK